MGKGSYSPYPIGEEKNNLGEEGTVSTYVGRYVMYGLVRACTYIRTYIFFSLLHLPLPGKCPSE